MSELKRHGSRRADARTGERVGFQKLSARQLADIRWFRLYERWKFNRARENREPLLYWDANKAVGVIKAVCPSPETKRVP